jgi:hypothetical protein
VKNYRDFEERPAIKAQSYRVGAQCISFRTSAFERSISEHVDDGEERLDAFLGKMAGKNGGAENAGDVGDVTF